MKKGLKKVICAVISASMLLSCTPFTGLGVVASAASAVSVYNCKGVQEGAFVEWAAVAGTDHYYVSYSKDGGSFVQIDDELVRQYPDRWRADIVGLAAGNYTIRVTAKDKSGAVLSETDTNCTVIAQDRTGFTFSPKSLAYDNGGCGAYNADGTLKSNARVIYVTEDNFDTISLDLKDKSGANYTATGLAEITKTMGQAASKGVTNAPLAVRFLGTIGDSHNGLASPSILETKGEKDNSKLDITFEGIGEDTNFYGLGLRLNGAANCEIRNIAFFNWHDDAIQLQGNENSNHWIHNNEIFYGENHGGDQAKGDGATDVKDDSKYITYSYNHYWDCGKTSLCGMKGESGDNYITYHHNWFDHSDSRHPRIRTMFVHVYNNYYDGNAKYGVGAALNSSAFVEGNYFRNCKHPMLTSLQGSDIMENSKTGVPDFSAKGTFSSENGGVIKAYNNYVIGSDADKFNGGYEPVYYDAADTKTNGKATQFDAYLAQSRDEQVPSSVKALVGGKTFNNANVDSYVLSIPVEEPAAAKDKVVANAGRTGNDFTYAFTEADDKDYEINTALAAAVQSYFDDKSDDYVSIGGAADGSGPVPTESTTSNTTESTTESTTSDSTIETTTSETSTEVTTNFEGTKVDMGTPETGFDSDNSSDTGANTSVTYDEATDTWTLTDTSSSAAATLKIPFEEISTGKVYFTANVTPSVSSSKWAFAQIRGMAEEATVESEIISISGDTNKKLAVRVNGTGYESFDTTLAAGHTYAVAILMDLDNGTAAVTVDGVTKNITGIDVASISSVYSVTSKSGSRNVSLANIALYTVNENTTETTEATTETSTEASTETSTEASTVATTETTEITTQNVDPTPTPSEGNKWEAAKDPALAEDGNPVIYAGNAPVFYGKDFDLIAGAGGLTSGDVTITNEDFTTTVVGKFVKDTSTDAAGREKIDTSAYGGKTADKVRVALTATAKTEGTIKVNLKANANKQIVAFDTNTKQCLYYFNATETLDPLTVELPITAGQSISFGAVGSSPWFYSAELLTGDEPVPTVVWGDVTDDGKVAADDVAMLVQYLLDGTAMTNADVADVNMDKVIDSEDAAMILQKALDNSYIMICEK